MASKLLGISEFPTPCEFWDAESIAKGSGDRGGIGGAIEGAIAVSSSPFTEPPALEAFTNPKGEAAAALISDTVVYADLSQR